MTNKYLTGKEIEKPRSYLSEEMVERYKRKKKNGELCYEPSSTYKTRYRIPRLVVREYMEDWNRLVDEGRVRLEKIDMKTAREFITGSINSVWSHSESCKEYTIYTNSVTYERRKQMTWGG